MYNESKRNKRKHIKGVLETIDLVRFRRHENSNWEIGLRMNEGSMNIIDEKGEFVEECWDYEIDQYNFSINIGGIISATKHRWEQLGLKFVDMEVK